jgi:hypothetical protein
MQQQSDHNSAELKPGDSEIIWPPPPPRDPWAHRRGEPRIFMLLWIGWLMLITAVSFASIGPRGIVDPDQARPSTRLLLLLLMCGVAFLWPAFRLCQVRPRRIIGAVLLDLVVISTPAQIVIWPQVLLAYWPVPVIVSISWLLMAWSVLMGAVLIFAYATEAARQPIEQPPNVVSRGIWLLVIVLLSLFAPAMSMLLPQHADPLAELTPASTPLLALSPVTGVYELTADRFWAGSSARVLDVHWAVLRWLGGGAAVLLTAACIYALTAVGGGGKAATADRPGDPRIG